MEAGKGFLENVGGKLLETKSRIIEFVSESLRNFVGWATNVIQTGIDAGVGFFNGVWNNVKNLPGEIWKKLVATLNNIYAWGRDMINAGIQSISGFVGGIVSGLKDLPNTIYNFVKSIPDRLKNLKTSFHNMAINLMNGFIDGLSRAFKAIWGYLNDFAKNVGNFISGVVSGFTGSSKTNGSHANGLDYVPYDGYVAELHKGERVLTRTENEAYTRGQHEKDNENRDKTTSTGDTFNFYNTKPEPYEYYRQVKKAKRELLYNV